MHKIEYSFGSHMVAYKLLKLPLSVLVSERKEFLVSGKMSCNFCQTEFPHRNEQVPAMCISKICGDVNIFSHHFVISKLRLTC